MREYEMICILKPDATEEMVDRVFGKLQKAMEEHNGTLLSRESWGKKKLAYDIRKNGKGLFFELKYLGAGGLNDEMFRLMRYDDAVLRFMSVRLADNVNPSDYAPAGGEAADAPAEA